MKKNYRYMVSTRCMTYNQKSYIEDALRGFAMQETTFPISFIIVDDASTDGEQEVLCRWAESHLDYENDSNLWEEMPYGKRAVANLKGKSHVLFVLLLLSENYYQSGRHSIKMGYISEWFDNAKYQSLCEGDDYWNNPLKLQKQVDFMERHPDCSMCFHNAVIVYDDVPKAPRIFNTIEKDKEIFLESLISKWLVPTASMLYRASCLPFFPVKERIVSGDWRMILHFASCGKVWALKDVMSVYRMTFNTDSQTSKHKNDGYYMCYQKYHILECFDEYTNFKYHDIVGKYEKFWYDYSNFTKRKEKSLFWAMVSMPLFTIRKTLGKF